MSFVSVLRRPDEAYFDPNTTNPDDWARISGRKGERIINVRTLITGMERKEQTIENVSSGQGQYL